MTDKIELTYGQAEQLMTNEQFRELITKPLPVKVSFRLARIMKKLQDELELYIQNKQELIKKYAVPREDGELADENGMVRFKDDEGPKQIAELATEKLPLTENKIPLSMDACPDLSIQETMMLLEFIEEIDEEEVEEE